MFAMTLATTPNLSLLAPAGLAILVWTVGILGAGYLVSKLPKRIAVMAITAVIVATAFARLNAQYQVPGLKCCHWIELIWLCVDWWSC
jgi:hypothetical protein